MTKIKLCGLSRPCDIQLANQLLPDYIGFVFAAKSKRHVTQAQAASLKHMLHPAIQAVGVFVREEPETVAALLNSGIIDVAQLHGGEDEAYIRQLRQLTAKPLIKAFRVEQASDLELAQNSTADLVLLDSGEGGTGKTFNWALLSQMQRPYFLAGGLHPDNVQEAIRCLAPYGVDVSSGIETDGRKDAAKMKQFVSAVRGV